MTAAARALGYTPSAISQQISKLERDVRQVLVEQNGRVATLSPAGRVVAEAAGRILSEIEQMQAQLENERKTVAGTLTLAAFATATRGVIPPALRRLRSDWPRLKCHLVEADSHHAMALVEDGSVDIAIVHDWLEMPLVLSTGLSARHLGNDISDVLVHVDSPPGRARIGGDGGAQRRGLAVRARLSSPRPAHSVLHGDRGRSSAMESRSTRARSRWSERDSASPWCPGWVAESCRTPSTCCPWNRRPPARSMRSGGPPPERVQPCRRRCWPSRSRSRTRSSGAIPVRARLSRCWRRPRPGSGRRSVATHRVVSVYQRLPRLEKREVAQEQVDQDPVLRRER